MLEIAKGLLYIYVYICVHGQASRHGDFLLHLPDPHKSPHSALLAFAAFDCWPSSQKAKDSRVAMENPFNAKECDVKRNHLAA
jgi:hypothetical protein